VSEEMKQSKTDKIYEIDLVEIFHRIWDNRMIIYKSIAISLFLGIIVAIGSPREYKSDVVLLVESSPSAGSMSGLLQQFGGLAGLSGLGINTGKEALTPELYPDVIKSTPFLLGILKAQMTDSRHDSTLLLSEFLERHTRKSMGKLLISYTIGLPGKLIRLTRGHSGTSPFRKDPAKGGPLKLTPRQNYLASELSKRIKAKQGESENTMNISGEMQDPQLAAQLVDSVVNSLTAYIIDYHTQKARADLDFVELSHREAEKKFVEAQRELASFKDRNMNIVSASAQITEQNLQSQYTLAFNIYNTLSQQLEQAKMKVQDITPVFKVIDPAKVPLEKSKPRIGLILFAMAFLGGMVGIGLVFWKTERSASAATQKDQII